MMNMNLLSVVTPPSIYHNVLLYGPYRPPPSPYPHICVREQKTSPQIESKQSEPAVLYVRMHPRDNNFKTGSILGLVTKLEKSFSHDMLNIIKNIWPVTLH